MTQAYEDVIELEVESLEAIPVIADMGPSEAYPYPVLRKTGRTQIIQFKVLVLENDHAKVCWIPDLGGRISSYTDKENDEFVPHWTSGATEAGPRGVTLDSGLQIQILGERRNSLGPVEYAIEELEHSDPEIRFFELCSGTGLSFEARWILPSNSSQLHLQVKLYNRTLDCQEASLNLLSGKSCYFSNGILHRASPTRGLVERSSSDLSVPFDLAPRQSVTWNATLYPFKGLVDPSVWSESGWCAIADDLITLYSTEPGQATILLDATGQTLEAKTALQSRDAQNVPLGGIKASAVRIHLPNGEELSWPGTNLIHKEAFRWQSSVRDAYESALRALRHGSDSPFATTDPSCRHAAAILSAIAAIRAQDWSSAYDDLETALLYNGDDPLTWWLKAAINRLGEADAETDDLLNAHFLSPLEPVLRAESFLASNLATKDPSALIATMADNPESMVEVACLLLEMGLKRELFRWVDECRRHRENPMLNLLLAFAYLAEPGM